MRRIRSPLRTETTLPALLGALVVAGVGSCRFDPAYRDTPAPPHVHALGSPRCNGERLETMRRQRDFAVARQMTDDCNEERFRLLRLALVACASPCDPACDRLPGAECGHLRPRRATMAADAVVRRLSGLRLPSGLLPATVQPGDCTAIEL